MPVSKVSSAKTNSKSFPGLTIGYKFLSCSATVPVGLVVFVVVELEEEVVIVLALAVFEGL
jgi:hypothetical protein